MMAGKTKIQIIGNYLDNMIYPLNCRNIKVENLISLCNPLAMAGHKNEFIATCAEQSDHMLIRLLAKGNLNQMLSHSKENFCSNYKYLPEGKEVRYQNGSEYIVVCNNGCGLRVYLMNGVLYSDTFPKDDLLLGIQKDENTIALDFPYTTIDWKELYDRFIDVILDEYDSEHIILIRTNATRWYQDGTKFALFDGRARDFRNQVEQMDIRFAERTGCHCIDIMYAHVPDKNQSVMFKYSSKTPDVYKELEYALDDIINQKATAYRFEALQYRSPLVNKLQRLLSKDVLEKYADDLCGIEKQSAYSLRHVKGTSRFYDDLRQLSRFVEEEWRYSLSDYITEHLGASLSEEDYRLLELAATYFKLTLDDIAGIYQLYVGNEDKGAFRRIVSNLCANSDCYPLRHTERFVEKNLARLSGYAYMDENLMSAELEGNYIRLANGCLLLLEPEGAEPIRMIDAGVKGTVDYKRVMEDGYACKIGEANALCYNWDFYIARAREGKGNHPVTVTFSAPEDFALSLRYIDYIDLLENELFVLSPLTGCRDFNLESFKTRTNLNFLFEKGTGIFHLRAGLGDQIIYYITSKRLQPHGIRTIYYDDVWTNSVGAIFNGTEIHKIIKEDIEDRLFSKILSPKLISSVKDMTIADHLYSHGCTEMRGVSNQESRAKAFKKCPHVFAPDVFSETMKATADVGIPYYNCWVAPIQYVKNKHFALDEYIQFPPFQSGDPNEKLLDSIKNCDSVVMHIRRGDHVSLGRDVDNSYYREALEKLCALPHYPNKKVFVFSDDIPWCRENTVQLGLDLFPDSDITFVDFNKEETSFRDIQMMSQAKIFVAAASGFSQIATMLARGCEIMVTPIEGWLNSYERYVRKNKYNIGRFTQDYTPDTTIRAPKEAKPTSTTATSPEKAAPNAKPMPNGESIEWLNFWFDMGNQNRSDRILLVGDSVSREYRKTLAQLTGKPVDLFASSAPITDELFWNQLNLFFSIKEYRQAKAHIQVGYHEIDFSKRKLWDNSSFSKIEQSFERLLVTVKDYIPEVTVATYSYITKPTDITMVDEEINALIVKINEVIVKVARKHGAPVNDMYRLTFENQNIYQHKDMVYYRPEVQELLAKQVAKAMKL